MEVESWGRNCFPIVVSLFSSIPFKHLSGHCVKVSMENPPGCPEEGDVEICLQLSLPPPLPFYMPLIFFFFSFFLGKNWLSKKRGYKVERDWVKFT